MQVHQFPCELANIVAIDFRNECKKSPEKPKTTFPGTVILNKDLRTSGAFPLDDLGQKHQLMTYGAVLEHIQQHIGRRKADLAQLVVQRGQCRGAELAV